MKQIFLFIGSIMAAFALNAQVVITTPYFPTLNSDITVTFDAAKGNGALNGASGPIYAHTGVITSTSTSGSDWKYVKGNWGTADPIVLMTSIGSNKYTISYNIKNFYGVPDGEAVLKLAFVFRNQAGSVVGRATDGGDIFYDVSQNATTLDTRIFTPDVNNFLLPTGQNIDFFGAASVSADLKLLDNGVQVQAVSGATTMNHVYQPATGGAHTLKFIATGGGATDTSTLLFTMPNASVVENPPAGTQLGANYLTNSSVRLMLEAPNKTNVFVIGSFNNWTLSTDYQMKKSVDGTKWWLDLTGLTPGQNVLYQYVVDGTIKIADPLSETVLDPYDDSFISTTVYPNMPPYPMGKTTGHISVITPGKTPYAWVNTSFVRPEKTDLIVYELLMRDFLAAHDYKALLDTLNYFDRMGVNVIELMPVTDFEGNISWGYGVSFTWH